jgi:hypothetical protein
MYYTTGGTAMKNITLSVDEHLLERARLYAKANSTTLNQLVRDFLARITDSPDPKEVARQFAAEARGQAGCSDEDFVFDREDTHRRGSWM